MIKKVIWSSRASGSLDYYCEIIAKESPLAAKKVRKEIILTAKTLSKNPELYQLDEHYTDNPGNIRRFFRWDYRVVYQVRDREVLIVNIYHSRRHPNKLR